jgi:hypothetical protein
MSSASPRNLKGETGTRGHRRATHKVEPIAIARTLAPTLAPVSIHSDATLLSSIILMFTVPITTDCFSWLGDHNTTNDAKVMAIFGLGESASYAVSCSMQERVPHSIESIQYSIHTPASTAGSRVAAHSV